MLPLGPHRDLARSVASCMHSERKLEAAKRIVDFCGMKVKLNDDNPAKYLPIIQTYLHTLLEDGAPEEAAQILWSPTQFTPWPQYTRDLWNLFDTSSMGLIMGAGSCSKSYGMGVRLFLEWIRDPMWTTIKVLGPSEDHLEANLFSHLVALHKSATLPMPGEVGELYIGMDRRNQISSIKGVIIPIGRSKKAGRLQGAKRKPRPFPHPTFGPQSRMFVFIDEIENVPGGLWSDIDNILTNVQEEGSGGFKIFGAYNPTNQHDEVGKRAEPTFGWGVFDPDVHYKWKSVRGWDVLRLDGEKSENVIQGRIIYSGLQTKAGLEIIARNAGGTNSPGYYSMGRGAYPPQGVQISIIPAGLLSKMRGEFIWLDTPRPVGACDLALEGGAASSYTLGRWGKATGMKLPPSLEFPLGQKIMFKDERGQAVTRWGLQADQQFALPKGDTVAMKTSLISVNKKAGVKPEYFACDRTGNGAGVADLMKYEWSASIHDINFSNSPSDSKLMLEDSLKCNEEYDRINSELWYALRAYGEFGYLLLGPNIVTEKLTVQVTQRMSKPLGKVKKVESKKDFMSRGHPSPDEVDSLTLFVHAARKGSGVVLSMKGADVDADAEDAGWRDEGQYKGGARIDVSNRSDYLDQNL